MEERVSPEEIVHLHRSVLELYGKELPDFVRLSFDVLLEIMVGYGLAYMEHLSLRTEQKNYVVKSLKQKICKNVNENRGTGTR